MSLFVLFVPTFNVFESTLVGVCAHSITLFMRLFLSLCESLWTHSHFCSLHFVYVRVCLCVQFRCLCKLHFCPAVSFCPLYAFLSLCVLLPSVFLPTVSAKSDLCVSTLLVLFVPTLGVCVYSRRCLRPLCFCPLCVVLVFLFILFHTKMRYFRHLGHIVTKASCKIFK